MEQDAEKVHNAVRDAYAKTATQSSTQNNDAVQKLSNAFGYDAADLAVIPQEANMGLQ